MSSADKDLYHISISGFRLQFGSNLPPTHDQSQPANHQAYKYSINWHSITYSCYFLRQTIRPVAN